MTTELRVERRYTIDEFMRLPDDGFGYELVGGRLQRMSPTGGEHGRIASLLNIHLGSYALANDLGDTYAAETAFVLNATSRDVRAPDVAFVASPRLDAIGEGAIPFAPDLAAEVISPSDRPAAIRRKVAEYLDAGVRLVWVVYPRRQAIEVCHPGHAPHDPGRRRPARRRGRIARLYAGRAIVIREALDTGTPRLKNGRPSLPRSL